MKEKKCSPYIDKGASNQIHNLAQMNVSLVNMANSNTVQCNLIYTSQSLLLLFRYT